MQKYRRKYQKFPISSKKYFFCNKNMFKFSQSIDYLGEYLTDFNKWGLEWELMVPATYLM